MKLNYPKIQTVAFSNALLNLCHQARTTQEDEIEFNLFKTEFISPFGIILLAGTIAECLGTGRKVKYIVPHRPATRKFLSGIGFNEFFKISDDNHRIESPKVQLRRIYHIDYFLTDQIIEVFNNSLTMTDGVKGSLKLALNELMTNAFDHSDSNRGCYVCAQSYKQSKKIRLCIADFGIGILSSLRKVPSLKYLKTDHESIRLAIKEGITSRKGGFAGYGLNHIYRFIRVNQGKMYILSDKGKLLWSFFPNSYKVVEQTMHFPFHGTMINLLINVEREGLYFLESERGSII